MKTVVSIAVSSQAERHSTYLNFVKIRKLSQHVWVECIIWKWRWSILGSSTGDNEIENGHQSVYTVEYSSDDSNSSEASSIQQRVCKRARPITSSEDSDAEDEWNWK